MYILRLHQAGGYGYLNSGLCSNFDKALQTAVTRMRDGDMLELYIPPKEEFE